MNFIDTELFRQWFYGAVILFYAVVMVWIMFFIKDTK